MLCLHLYWLTYISHNLICITKDEIIFNFYIQIFKKKIHIIYIFIWDKWAYYFSVLGFPSCGKLSLEKRTGQFWGALNFGETPSSNTDIAMQQLCYSGQVLNPCACLNFLICKFRVISLIQLPCMSHLISAKWPIFIIIIIGYYFVWH